MITTIYVLWTLGSFSAGGGNATPLATFSSLEACEKVKEKIDNHVIMLKCIPTEIKE